MGAPHLIDPSKLLVSAGRLYGEENMDRLGEVAPVPEANVTALAGGEEVEGFRVEHTPGHAGHHLCWLDIEPSATPTSATPRGWRIPPSEFTLAPTPPPEIDVEAWMRSIDLIDGLAPERLRLTHFGSVDDPGAQLGRMRASLRRNAELAREGDRDEFIATLEREIAAAADGDGAASFLQALPPDQSWLGLERYWRKRAERAADAATDGRPKAD